MIINNTGNILVVNQNPKYIVSKIEYYDTPYAVPTRGFSFEYYDDPDQNSSLDFASNNEDSNLVSQGKANILSYDWGFGAPPGVSNTGYFKAKYYGYFYVKYAGVYNFRVFKEESDYLQAWSERNDGGTFGDPSTTGSYSASSKKVDDWGSNHTSLTSGTWSITMLSASVGKWHPITVLLGQREKKSYITVQYLEPQEAISSIDGSESDNDPNGNMHNGVPAVHWKPLSAGSFAYEPAWSNNGDAGFIQPTIITGAISPISIQRNFNKSSTASFQLPVTKGIDSNTYPGYKFDSFTKLYYNSANNSYLREGRLIRIFTGYATGGGVPDSWTYLKRFEGVITNININKQDSNQTFISVECQDILYFLNSSINENYPNDISYEMFNFREQFVPKQPNGVSRPKAYDSWPLVDTVRDIYIKAGIDPTLLYGRRTYLDRDGLVVTGDYYIEDKQIDLKRRVRYGNPFLVDNDLLADDRYIWSFNFGDSLQTNLSTLADQYGFVIETSPNGYPTFYSTNGYRTVLPSSLWIDSGDWTEIADSHAEGGYFVESTTSGGILVTGFIGAAFSIDFVKVNVSTHDENKEWNPVVNELRGIYDPDRNVTYDYSFRTNYFGTLYGRTPTFEWLSNPLNDLEVVYINSMIYFRPLVSMTISRISYYAGIDYGSFLEEDYGLNADIYMGRVTSSDYQTLLSSSMVYQGYKRPFRGVPAGDNRWRYDVELETPYAVTSGNIYAIRFSTNEDSTIDVTDPTVTYPILYGIENTLRLPDDGANYVHMSMENITYDTVGMSYSNNGFLIDSGLLDIDGNELFGGVYCNMSFQTNPNRASRITILAKNPTTSIYEQVSSWDVNMNYYDPLAERPLRYVSDGPDKRGINPCQFYIGASDISKLLSEGVRSSFGDYLIQIEDLSSIDSGTRINSITVYEQDIYNPSWNFDTRSNIISIGYEEDLDSIRNDVIIVGDLKGAVSDFTTQEIVNKNNPTYDYIYSRAVDLSSIYNPNAVNNVGRQKPFIIYQPSIIDQRHADWFAQAIVKRYNKFVKYAKFNSIGVPILGTNDSIILADTADGDRFADYSMQWINSIKEDVGYNTYFMSVEASPYEPWTSFQPRLNPDISRFNNYPFVNIRMTDTNDNLRGYDDLEMTSFDVYESELSGVRLRAKYDQLIDGDIIVKVMTQQVLGVRTERTVAYLVGHLEDGVEIPEYREWGNDYELIWDGVDQTGNSRALLEQSITERTSGGFFITANSDDFIADYKNPGFYAPSGYYFLRFLVIPRDKSIEPKIVDSNKLSRTLNTEIADRLSVSTSDDFYEQTFQLKWGSLPHITMTVSGQQPLSAKRNITYYPNNIFWDDDNSGNGAEFNFIMTNTNDYNRLLYYNVGLDHVWAIGYTFGIRNDAFDSDGSVPSYPTYSANNSLNWRTAYELGMKGSYLSKKGLYNRDMVWTGGDTGSNVDEWWIASLIVAPPTQGDEVLPNYIHRESNQNDWGESQTPLNISSRQKIVESGGRHKVFVWADIPYITYRVSDYIETRKHRYRQNNPIRFFVNPGSVVAGGWEFLGIPDLTEEAYNSFRKNFALAAYYAGRTTGEDYRIQFMTSHAFQVNVAIWDNTGRIVNNPNQKIGYPMEPHTHKAIYNSNNTLSSGYDVELHSHNEDVKINTSQIDWDLPLKNLNGVNHTYNMIVTGIDFTSSGTYNFGNGYCNISGMPAYKFWTWHGYWKSTTYSDNLIDIQIPFEHWMSPQARHWCRYARPHESGLLNFAAPNNNNPRASITIRTGGNFSDYVDFEGGSIFWTNNGLTTDPRQELVQSGINAFYDDHTHLPIYEGLNASIDPYGLIEYSVTSLNMRLAFFDNDSWPITGIYHGYLSLVPSSWEQPTQFKLGSTAVSRDKYLNVTNDFPKIWYKLDRTLPWDNTAGVYHFWQNFLVESGFGFLRGGWADLIE